MYWFPFGDVGTLRMSTATVSQRRLAMTGCKEPGLVKTTLGTNIGAECSKQMQLAQGHHLNADLVLVLPAFGCCIPLLYLCPRWS